MIAQANTSALFEKLKAAKRLPSPPGTALRVLELCRRDNVELQELSDALMSDPALAGRLLKFANSPVAGLPREVISIREALLLLGLRTVKMTALGFSLASPDLKTQCAGFDLKQYWTTSFTRAVIARRIAAEFFKLDREQAFTVGLLSQVGRMAFAQVMPVEYSQVVQAVALGAKLVEAERRVFGIDHTLFGGQLLKDWELPDMLVQAVMRQLEPSEQTDDAGRLAHAINVAGRLEPAFTGAGLPDEHILNMARDCAVNTLKLDEAGWKQLSEDITRDFKQVAEVFDAQINNHQEVMDLYAEAQEEATRVGMVSQMERARTEQENVDLLKRATTDGLTGVANRARFDERIAEFMKGLRRGHGDFALLIFDVDHFKKFNDTFGHQVGDLVLKRVATAVENSLREVDFLARYGGEEFALIAPHTDRRGACIVAARIRKTVADLKIKQGDQTFSVTISIGLTLTSDYAEPPSLEQIIKDADTQLYCSKNAGRNTWSYQGRAASQVAQKSSVVAAEA